MKINVLCLGSQRLYCKYFGRLTFQTVKLILDGFSLHTSFVWNRNRPNFFESNIWGTILGTSFSYLKASFLKGKLTSFILKLPCQSCKLTYTLSAISSISWWTGPTFIPTGIGWRWKINALNSCIARLTITLAGVNVTVTKPSCVSPLTCATHVYKLAVSVDFVAFFWLHTLTAMVAGAHVNCWTPSGTCTFVVSSNEWQIELQLETKVIISRFYPLKEISAPVVPVSKISEFLVEW